MESRLNIPYPVIVEGKYDKLTLCRVLDADIITTDGFGIFRNSEKQAFLRALAAKTKVIVLTDPDGAGGVIRSKICGMLPKERVIRLYVPAVPGKEKRKPEPSKAGLLGVEGTDIQLLYDLFLPYSSAPSPKEAFTLSMADLYRDGLAGRNDSSSMRDILGKKFGLPPGMSAKALLTALRFIATDKEYGDAVSSLIHTSEETK